MAVLTPGVAGLVYMAIQASNAYTSYALAAHTMTVEEAKAGFKKTQGFVADSGKLWDKAGEIPKG